MAEQIPHKYSGHKNSTTISQMTIKCPDADRKENKEDYLIFESETQREVLTFGIFKGAQTAQRHLVELTRNQYMICSEEKEKKDGNTSIRRLTNHSIHQHS